MFTSARTKSMILMASYIRGISSSRFLTIFLTLLMLTGCGFHLRGAFTLPAHLQIICIQPDDPYEPLQKELRRALVRNNIQVIATPDAKTAILTLTTPEFAENISAFNSNGQAQRFKITMSFQYQVAYAGTVVRGFTSIFTNREITLTPNQILSSENEKRTIKDELLQEAIGQLLRQLATIPETKT